MQASFLKLDYDKSKIFVIDPEFLLNQWYLSLELTAVALSIAKVTANQVLRPEGVACALFGDWITLATPRTAKQAH